MTRLSHLGGVQRVAVSSTGTPVAPLGPDPRALMARFVDLFYLRRQVRAAFESCVVRTGFRDHDPSRPGGRQAAIELLAGKLADPAFGIEVERVFVDGDRAVVHARVAFGGVQSQRMDLFRLADGRIVEHWGFVEAVASERPALPAGALT